jgi:hypothetical protein
MTNTIIQQIDNARCPISTIHESDTGSINDDHDDDDGEDLQEDLQEEGDDISYGKGSPTSSFLNLLILLRARIFIIGPPLVL